jgi:hypothetical protein
MTDGGPPYELRFNEDGDPGVLLAAEVGPEGWSLITLRRDAARFRECQRDRAGRR